MNVQLVLLIVLCNMTCLRASRILVSLFAIELGAPQYMIGVMIALYAVFPAMLAVYAGRLADRIGPRWPLIGGTAGGVIGYAFVDLQVTGDSSLWAGLGALFGAVVAALGTAVVVILTLRAMGEWNTIRAREELAAASAKSNAANRNVPRVR